MLFVPPGLRERANEFAAFFSSGDQSENNNFPSRIPFPESQPIKESESAPKSRGKRMDRRSEREFRVAPDDSFPFFSHEDQSHVFFREVTVLMTASLHAGSFRSNLRVPSVYPIPSSLSDSSRVFVVDDKGVPVARSQNNGKTTIGPSQGRWVPHRNTGHFPRRVESSTRARALRARETRQRRRGVEVSPPFLRTLATSAGRAPF